MLKRKLKVEKLHGLELYKQLKAGLAKVWKAKDLLSLLDKRANQKEYVGQVSTEFIAVAFWVFLFAIHRRPAQHHVMIICMIIYGIDYYIVTLEKNHYNILWASSLVPQYCITEMHDSSLWAIILVCTCTSL